MGLLQNVSCRVITTHQTFMCKKRKEKGFYKKKFLTYNAKLIVSQELLTEQIQILQGKISCLEDEISRATMEEVGENMGPVMEVKCILLCKNILFYQTEFRNVSLIDKYIACIFLTICFGLDSY